MIIATPVGRSFIAEYVYKDCEILVEGRELAADLISLSLKEFDAILGMDWLSLRWAQVDCSKKEVTLYTMKDERVCFLGERRMIPSSIISALTTTKMLRKGCEAFLACAISSEGSGTSLADIPVVCWFPDVFPEELPGLPPSRKMEFSIDLVLDTRPTSTEPYRLAHQSWRSLRLNYRSY